MKEVRLREAQNQRAGRHEFRVVAAGALLFTGASTSMASPSDSPNWAALLEGDAVALHTTYLESHPGAVDARNPGFHAAMEAGLARALAQAKSAQSYGAYWWALREYGASFDDGHVFIEALPKAPESSPRWPGFLTREVGGRHLVAARAELPYLPAIGSELISCDGIAAAELATQLVGRFRGRWELGSQREAHAWRLFLDAGNPWVKRPKRCLFRNGETQQAHDLSWFAMTKELFQKEAEKVSTSVRAPIEVRRFGERGLWVSMGSFSGDITTQQGRAIAAVVDALRRDPTRLTAADTVVLDVRGNGGGSSRWGNEVAALLWGKRQALAAKPQSGGVDWRPSMDNIAAVEAYRRQSGTGFFARMFMGRIISGMKAALAARQPLWREKAPPRSEPPPARDPASVVTAGRAVYILTDGGCASACLDAMDVWTRAGALPIGRETSADSLYMEIRKHALPSGLASISVPMKVYRGRPRGANVSYKPVHEFKGDMRDQKAIEAWIAGLPSGERVKGVAQ